MNEICFAVAIELDWCLKVVRDVLVCLEIMPRARFQGCGDVWTEPVVVFKRRCFYEMVRNHIVIASLVGQFRECNIKGVLWILASAFRSKFCLSGLT